MLSFVLEAREDESDGDSFWNRNFVLPCSNDLEERDLRARFIGEKAALERRRKNCIMMPIATLAGLNFILLSMYSLFQFNTGTEVLVITMEGLKRRIRSFCVGMIMLCGMMFIVHRMAWVGCLW
jgi:hypothetical protein